MSPGQQHCWKPPLVLPTSPHGAACDKSSDSLAEDLGKKRYLEVLNVVINTLIAINERVGHPRVSASSE